MRHDKQLRREDRLRQRLQEQQNKVSEAEREKARIIEILNSTMHEVRSLTSELTSQASSLMRMLSGHDLESHAATVLHISEMVTARLAYTDLQLNPGAISLQTKVPAGLYRKFEKARYVLGKSERAKSLNVRFHGQSFGELQVLQAFELIPFIILDNAVKYSPPSTDIDVHFSESSREIRAEVRSLGPALVQGEQDKLFEQHFRGENAKKLPVYGAGLGLYVARNIADLHDSVTISAVGESKVRFVLNSVAYAEFRVEVCAGR